MSVVDYDRLVKEICENQTWKPDEKPAYTWSFSMDEDNYLPILAHTTELLADEYKRFTGKPYGSRRFWFRGERKADRPLLPSLLRNLSNCKDDDYPYLSLRDRKHELRNQNFYGLSDSPSDDADYLALIHYYSLGSTFIEFTTDAYQALYYALRNTISARNFGGFYIVNPTLYVFCPELFNLAMQRLWEKGSAHGDCGAYLGVAAVSSYFSSLQASSPIPNLSVAGNYEPFSFLLCGEQYSTRYHTYFPKDFCLETLPLAVQISRADPRRQNRSGYFVAYNPFVPYSAYQEHICSTLTEPGISMERLQEYYIKNFPDRKPFLYKLAINPVKDPKPFERIMKHLQATGLDMPFQHD